MFGRAAIDVRPREWRPRELRRLAARWMLVACASLKIRSTCQHETLQNQLNFAHVSCFPMATYQRVTLQHQFNLAFNIVFCCSTSLCLPACVLFVAGLCFFVFIFVVVSIYGD